VVQAGAIRSGPPFANPIQIAAITCRSTRFCVALDTLGNVLSSRTPTRGASAWAIRPVLRGGGIPPTGAVSCPSAHLCVGAGVQGQIITSTALADTRTRWKDVFIDTIKTVNGPFSQPLSGVSCPSVKLCVATDWVGNVFTSRHPAGRASAWSETNVKLAFFGDPLHPSLAGVSCPTPSLCVAVDGGGNVLSSTDPTGGASAWTSSNVVATAIRGVSCPSASLCVAVTPAGTC